MAIASARFGWQEDELIISLCWECKHRQPLGKCDAYLAGIPDAILTNTHDHHEVYPGDQGIQFEPIKGKGRA